MQSIPAPSRLAAGLFWAALTLAAPAANAPVCKCGPRDACWPRHQTWDQLNTTVNGALIATDPVAISCYPGPAQDAAECAAVNAGWADAVFQADDPVGLSYPINATCPPVPPGETPSGSCTIGTSPRYAVNATSAADVAAAVDFAAAHNVRLVIKNTGHDILGRSTGSGSLEIWLRHLRTGIDFHPASPLQCPRGEQWNGSTIRIGGGYTFDDVYAVAEAHNVVVVGGGTPSVGALGGWMQGGGHGPASREFGLGADQVLQAEVVLADGSVVTADACQNADVFWAIRGGGPGTYGVVTSTLVKAYPTVSVQVQHVAIAPLNASLTDDLLGAVAILYAAYPDLNDAGYAGYGSWAINSPTPLFANFTAGYVHGFYTFNHPLADTRAAFAPTLAALQRFNGTSLAISVDYVEYATYWAFYAAESGVEAPVGAPAALGSRLFDRAAVTGNHNALLATLHTLAGAPAESASNNFELVSGGANFARPAAYSALHPAWRRSYFSHIVARGWGLEAGEEEIQEVYDDVLHTKQTALQRQAPGTGAYMNEASWADPGWKANFYGPHYDALLRIKRARDPDDVFYCATCVGGDRWREDGGGRLCRVSSSARGA